ncbi:hypothetical protein ABW20_dc0102188 [Dactylellina cionopaga]|nr:hypothetical protein ABW20_dc0102188 [Dactylellina cionopaga]
MLLFMITQLFALCVSSHETNLVLTDSLKSPTCKLPAFRFYQNATLVLNELIPTDNDLSTCSWHDDIITTVQMCGASGAPYQCALYTDNTCGNGNINHATEAEHMSVSPNISNVYKIVFSDPTNVWIKVSWTEADQQQLIKSYECIPSTAEEFGAFTGETKISLVSSSGDSGDSSGGSEASGVKEIVATTTFVTYASPSTTGTAGIENVIDLIVNNNNNDNGRNTATHAATIAAGWLIGILIMFIFL